MLALCLKPRSIYYASIMTDAKYASIMPDAEYASIMPDAK